MPWRLQSGAEGAAAVAGAVVAHDPLDLDAALGEAATASSRNAAQLRGALGGVLLADREAGVVVDGHVGVLPAGVAVAVLRPVKPSARLPTRQKRPSCLASRCTSPPAWSYS